MPENRRITIEHLWVAAPFFVMLSKNFRVPLPLLDFWWHLKMGEIIVATRSIPRTDLFSFTAAGKPFIVQNWLAEVIYYKLYQLGGPPLLIFLNTLLLAAALIPVFLLCRESTRRIRLASLSTLLACIAFAGNARPQVFSFVLFAFFYWVLNGYRFQRRDRLWLLPVAMVLWVNLHGAFAVGLALIAVILGSEIVRRLSASPDALSWSQLRKLGLVFGACIAATVINPETYRIYDYIRVVLADKASQLLVMEWQPPRIDTLLGIQMFYGLFALAMFGLVYSRKRPNLTDLSLFLVFSIFALTALRNTAWFAIVIAPVIARYLTEIELPGLAGFRERIRLLTPAMPHANSYNKFNLAIAALAFFILVILSPWVRPIFYHADLLDPQTPVRAVDYIEQHDIRGPIFHPQVFGDYLIWRLYPQERSFIDGRVHLFGEDFVRRYRNLFYDSHWEEQLASFGIEYLLLSKDSSEADSINLIHNAQASKHWAVLFEDNVSILLKKNVFQAP